MTLKPSASVSSLNRIAPLHLLVLQPRDLDQLFTCSIVLKQLRPLVQFQQVRGGDGKDDLNPRRLTVGLWALVCVSLICTYLIADCCLIAIRSRHCKRLDFVFSQQEVFPRLCHASGGSGGKHRGTWVGT